MKKTITLDNYHVVKTTLENGCKVETLVNSPTLLEVEKEYKLPKELEIDSYYTELIDKEGNATMVDIYSIGNYVAMKSLKDATTKRAIEIYEHRLSSCKSEFQDYVLTCGAAMFCGYTNKYNKSFNGIAQGEKHFTNLMSIAFKALNQLLVNKGVIGINLGVEVVSDSFVSITNIFGLPNMYNHCISVNEVRYNNFLLDIKKRIKSAPALKVFELICEHDCYFDTVTKTRTNSNGEVEKYTEEQWKMKDIAIALNMKSTTSVKRAKSTIIQAAKEVIQKYNMKESEFVAYIIA